jgi:hypothetical protein
MADDPFAVLGLGRDASLAEIRAARRRLALVHHPDRDAGQGLPSPSSGEEMRRINAAFDAAVAHATGRRPLAPAGSGGAPTPASAASPAPAKGRTQRPAQRWRGVQHDAPSFTIDVLPVEAFEALLVVTSWIGEVLVDEPPYLLDVHVFEPACWCRLELVPDAGGTTVSLAVASPDDGAAPDVEVVRDLWVDQLNQLGQWAP